MAVETSEFDRMFQAVDPLFDQYFAKEFWYRVSGSAAFPITASLQAHAIQVEAESHGAVDSWHGHVFEVRADALLLDGVRFDPAEGHEILERVSGGYQVYLVVPPPGQRCFDSIDGEDFKLLIFTVKRRIESI